MTTLLEFQAYAFGRVVRRSMTHEREGQALYNALREKRPDLEARICGTDLDTFNNDAAAGSLWVWIADNWNSEAEGVTDDE